MKLEEAITYAIMSDGHGKTTDQDSRRYQPQWMALAQGRQTGYLRPGLCLHLPLSLNLYQGSRKNLCNVMTYNEYIAQQLQAMDEEQRDERRMYLSVNS